MVIATKIKAIIHMIAIIMNDSTNVDALISPLAKISPFSITVLYRIRVYNPMIVMNNAEMIKPVSNGFSFLKKDQ